MSILSGNFTKFDVENKEILTQQIKNLNKELAEITNIEKPSQSEISEMKQLGSNLLKIAKSTENELKLLITCCILEILRIVAPAEIFTSPGIKNVFSLIVDCCKYLENPELAAYSQILQILRILVDISASILAVKSNNTNVLVRLIENMYEFVQNNCGHSAEQFIAENIKIILEELPEINETVISTIMLGLSSRHKSTAKFRISSLVLQKVPARVKEYISSYLHELFVPIKTSSFSKLLQSEKFSVAVEIYKINHDYLLGLLCGISDLLQGKDSEKLIIMVGKISACKKSRLYYSNSHLFQEFFKLFNSPSESTRQIMVGFLGKFLKNHSENRELVKSIKEIIANRLRDSSILVRKALVGEICKILEFRDLKQVIIARTCERLRDTKHPVRLKTVKGLSKVFFTKCVQKSISGAHAQQKYFCIIEEILKVFKGSTPQEQLEIVNAVEEIVLPLSLLAEERVKGLEFLYSILGDSEKQVIKIILKSKAFWGETLLKVIEDQSNFEMNCQVFAGNIREPVQYLAMKREKKENNSAVFILLSMDEVRNGMARLCSNAEHSEKVEICTELKIIIEKCATAVQEAYNTIRARCINLLISHDQIKYAVGSLPLLSAIGYAFPSLIILYIDEIVQNSAESLPRKSLLDLIANVDFEKLKSPENITEIIVRILEESEDSQEILSAVDVIKKLKFEDAESLFETSANALCIFGPKLLKNISVIKEITKKWPKFIENYKEDLKNDLVAIIEKETVDIRTKCTAIGLIKTLMKKVALSPDATFKYLRNLTFFLDKSLENLALPIFFDHAEDTIAFKSKCLKSIISLLRVSEYKSLLDPKTLACIGQMAMVTEYQSFLSSVLLKDIYEKSKLLPPLLSILGLLQVSSEASKIKEALIKVLQNMKSRSKDQKSEENKLKLQPETYTPYLFFVICKCGISSRNCNKILTGYLKCMSHCDRSFDVNYLVYLSSQLQKMTLTGKRVKSDFFDGSPGLELEKVCNEFSLILMENYIPSDFLLTATKLLIPSAYFVKDSKLSSPIVKKIEEKSALKRMPEDSPRQKKFKND